MRRSGSSLLIAANLIGLSLVTPTAGGSWRTGGGNLEPRLRAAIAEANADAAEGRASRSLVTVELLTADESSTVAAVTAIGGTVTGTVPGAVVQASVPSQSVSQLAVAPSVDSIRSPRRSGEVPERSQTAQFGPTSGEGVALSDADAWQAAGITGAGVKVGIVDYFDMSLWNPAEHGPAPTASNGRAFCRDTTGSSPSLCNGSSINSAEGEAHGVAVAEIIKDMAPGAELYIAQVATLADLRAAIDFFDSRGVTIMSRSLVSKWDGAGDGTGPGGALVDYAASKGITWFNAAGNTANDNYMRFNVTDTNGNARIEFAPNDELLRVDGAQLQPGVYCWVMQGVRWSNDWYLPDGQVTDYRVEVYEASSPAGIGSNHTNPSSLVPLDLYPNDPTINNYVDFNQRSTSQFGRIGVNEDPLEMSGESWCNDTGVSYLRIRRDTATPAGGDVMEIGFLLGLIELDYGDAAGSASMTIGDSKNQALVSVGAIDPPGSGTVAIYSAQGPTIDGRLKPEVTGHSCVLSTVYSPSCFDGTSAATPEAAGMAALIQDANLAVPGAPLAAMVRAFTINRGAAGPDNVYGYGELRLPAPPVAPPIATPSKYVPLASPQRILNTRPSSPVGPTSLIGPHNPGVVLNLPVLNTGGIPASGVSAVALNIASVDATTSGYIQAIPTLNATLGATASLNVSTPGPARSNFAIVPVGVGGRISLYLHAGGNVTVDVLGYFSSGAGTVADGRFVPIAPERWTSTRDADLLPTGFTAVRPANTNETLRVATLDGTAVDLTQADALVVYVTAAGASSGGFLRAQPTGANGLTTATVNFNASGASGNTSIVPLDEAASSISVFSSARADVFVDVVGYITDTDAPASTSGTFLPVTPGRSYSSTPGAPYAPNSTRTATITGRPAPAPTIPAGVSAVSANLAVGQPAGGGFLKAYAGTLPDTASVNYIAGKTTSTGSLVQLSATGTMMLTMSASGHVYVDVNGYFL